MGFYRPQLRAVSTAPVNVSHVLYYACDSGGKSPKCVRGQGLAAPAVTGLCIDGVIDPTTGTLLPGVAAAVLGR